MAVSEELIKRLTKPSVSDSWGLVYWEVSVHKDEEDEAIRKYFIEEEPARAYQLEQMRAGHIVWVYCRHSYQVRTFENIKFEDE